MTMMSPAEPTEGSTELITGSLLEFLVAIETTASATATIERAQIKRTKEYFLKRREIRFLILEFSDKLDSCAGGQIIKAKRPFVRTV